MVVVVEIAGDIALADGRDRKRMEDVLLSVRERPTREMLKRGVVRVRREFGVMGSQCTNNDGLELLKQASGLFERGCDVRKREVACRLQVPLHRRKKHVVITVNGHPT